VEGGKLENVEKTLEARERTNKLNSHDTESGDGTQDHRSERQVLSLLATHASL
jgi:hypothetical protein